MRTLKLHFPDAALSTLDLHSALHTKGTVCSGLRTALLVYQSRRPVRAAEAIDVGLSGGALRHAF